jgi:UDP-N-acetylmuramyl pentapeptide phosphotransferase/UDP-N-acetylglucosamine-1-phosphate transferase
MIYLLILPVFFIALILYFKLAIYYKIVDKPNIRSSHSEVTIRGGGIIYLVAAVTSIFLHFDYWLLVAALFTIGSISFLDDRITISSRIRLFFHLAAVTGVFYFLGVFSLMSWWLITLLYVIVIGIINAYNFMDGINGITGLYSLVVFASLQYINFHVTHFIEPDLVWLPILASIVFLFFNFRTKAKCFAGDVGSITVALWIIFLILKLILQSNNFNYLFFLSVYGVDTIMTILHRLKFYQILANDCKIPHLYVSVLYAGLQLFLNIIIIKFNFDFYLLFFLVNMPLCLLYITLKPSLMIPISK